MDTVATAVSDLNHAAEMVRQAVSQRSDTALTQTLDDADISAHDALAQLIGWQEYVLTILPVVLNQIDNPLPAVDADARNRRAVVTRENVGGAALLTEFMDNHRHIVEIVGGTTAEALLMRRTRNERIFTVKSYVVDQLVGKMLEFAEQLTALP